MIQKTPARAEFPEQLAARVLSAYPTPIADALVALLAADSAFERRDRIVEVFRAELRLLAAMVLAVRIQFGPGPEGEAPTVPDLLRSLRARGLTDGQWVAVVRELLRPWVGAPDSYPIAGIVELVHGRKSELVRLWDELLVMRKSETVAHGASGTREALLAILAKRTPQLARTLELLDPVLSSVRIAATRASDEQTPLASLFVGPTPASGRARAIEAPAAHAAAPGDVVLLDDAGQAKVALSPVVIVRRATRDGAEELFLLDGSARRGALYVAFPSMAEHKELAAWESISDVLTADQEKASDDEQPERPARPYRGLASFGPAEASLFFGREDQAEALANRIRRHGWVTVTGPSGSGKTSLLRAGVLPTLRDTNIAFLRPGAHPLASLASRLAEATAIERDRLDLLLHQPAELCAALDQVARASATSLLLVIDQGEELLTLTTNESEREAFGRALVALAESHATTRVVFSVREDFFARLASVRSLFGVFSAHVEVVTTPDRDALIRMLVGPARAFGYAFEDDAIVTGLLDAVADARAALALLSFAADRLWEARDRTWKRLTLSAYQAMGGPMGALASHAGGVLGAMAPSELRAARSIFLRLVTSERTRAVAMRSEVLEAARDAVETSRVLDRLISARLITAGEDAAGTATIEIVHEALIQHWDVLVRWLSEDEEGQRLTHALRQSSREWSARGRPRGLLWRGELLDELNLYLRRANEPLTGNERAFADACRKDANAQRRLRTGLLAGAFVALAAFGAFMFVQWRATEAARVETEHERQATANEKTRAEVRGLVAEARAKEGRGLTDDAHALIRSAVQLEGELGIEDETAQSLDLARLSAAGAGAMVFSGPTRPIMHVKTAPAHRRLFAIGSDDDVFVLDADTGHTVERLPHVGWIVWDAAVSSDQRYFATGSSDSLSEHSLLRVYALPSLELVLESAIEGALREVVFADANVFVRRVRGPLFRVALADGEPRAIETSGDDIISVAAAEDGFAVASSRRTTWVLDELGNKRVTIAGPEDFDVTTATISASGNTVARGRADGMVELFDAGDGHSLGRMRVQSERVGKLVLTSEHELVAATEDGKLDLVDVRNKRLHTYDCGRSTPRFVVSERRVAFLEGKGATLVDLDSGAMLASRIGHDGETIDVALHEGRLVTTGWDRTLRLWPDRPYPVERVVGGDTGLSLVAFSGDRQRVAVGPKSGQAGVELTVRTTTAFGDRPLFQRKPPGFLRAIALDAKGEQLAWASELGGAEIIELSTGRTTRSLTLPGEKIASMATSADLGKIAVGDAAGALHLFEAEGARASYGVVPGAVTSALLSPDGTTIATIGADRVARLNRWEDGAEVFAMGLFGIAGQLAFSPDGAYLAIGDHARVRVVRLATGALAFERETEENAVIGLSFSPDSQWLAAATSSSGKDGLWLIHPADSQVRVLDSKDAAMDMSFSPDSRRLLAGSNSGTLTIWQDGREPATVYRPFNRGVLAARFLGDGEEVLGASFGSGLAVVKTPPASRRALLEDTGKLTNLRVCRSSLAVVAVDPGGPTDAFASEADCVPKP